MSMFVLLLPLFVEVTTLYICLFGGYLSLFLTTAMFTVCGRHAHFDWQRTEACWYVRGRKV